MMGFGLVFILVAAGAIAYALGWRPRVDTTGPAQPGEKPVEILKARYARGEITSEEYEAMRQDLEG